MADPYAGARRYLPASVLALRDYTPRLFAADLIAGITVGLVALPLAMAFAISSGMPPQAGIYCAVVTGFLISALGGSTVQIGGPTGAFVVVVSGIVATYGVDGLRVGTVTARNVGESGLLLNQTINANVGTVDAENAGAGTGYAAFRMANRNGRIGSSYPTNIRVGTVRARGGGRGVFCVSESGGAVYRATADCDVAPGQGCGPPSFARRNLASTSRYQACKAARISVTRLGSLAAMSRRSPMSLATLKRCTRPSS